MHTHNLEAFTHEHRFHESSQAAERGTRAVMWITLVMMVVEIAAGWFYNSMALLADGWHMSSHAVAIGVSAFAYGAARRHSKDARFAFGTWKIEILGGYSSAIVLLGVVALMAFSSVERLFAPAPIHYEEAIVVAVIGLVVNLVCAVILMRAGGGHGHSHGGHSHGGHSHAGHSHAGHVPKANVAVPAASHTQHAHSHGSHSHGSHSHGSHSHDDHAHDDHAHDHDHDHDRDRDRDHTGTAAAAPAGDLNLRSAYIHVLADAGTSVLAIAALLGGMWLGWSWLDPVMGLVGAVVVASWARGLIGQTSRILLDREMDAPVVEEIREACETTEADSASYTRVTDLHVWRVGQEAYACALTLVTHDASLTADDVRRKLAIHEEIVHATIEINRCA